MEQSNGSLRYGLGSSLPRELARHTGGGRVSPGTDGARPADVARPMVGAGPTDGTRPAVGAPGAARAKAARAALSNVCGRAGPARS